MEEQYILVYQPDHAPQGFRVYRSDDSFLINNRKEYILILECLSAELAQEQLAESLQEEWIQHMAEYMEAMGC